MAHHCCKKSPGIKRTRPQLLAVDPSSLPRHGNSVSGRDAADGRQSLHAATIHKSLVVALLSVAHYPTGDNAGRPQQQQQQQH